MYSTLSRGALIALAIGSFAAGCGEFECRSGYDKVGKLCLSRDGSVDAVGAGDGGRDVDAVSGAATTMSDSGSASDDGGPRFMDGGTAQSSTPDAGSSNASDGAAPASAEAGPVEPTVECDATRTCSAGYQCSMGKCLSACAQKQCDPNATCSLVAGAAVCTCNSGYIAMSGAAGSVTCAQDIACKDLGCHATNATCELGSNQLRSCVCKNGYTGDGKTCTPVSCPAASTLSITSGTVTTPNGAVYNQTANYACNAGYRLVGSSTRTCGADGTWSGTAAMCEPRDCGPLSNPAHGRVDTSAGTTVGSPGARYSCEANYTLVGSMTRTCQGSLLGATWSGTAPRCLGCGDGVVSTEINEECEPRVGAATSWTCNSATCKRSTIYTYCSSVADCNLGESCGAQAFCSRSCSGGATCPAVPTGVPVSVNSTCLSSACFAQGCGSNADCAPGLVCYGRVCTSCNPGAFPCPAPQTCVVPSGAGYGRCQ
jgi:hypothetical protein